MCSSQSEKCPLFCVKFFVLLQNMDEQPSIRTNEKRKGEHSDLTPFILVITGHDYQEHEMFSLINQANCRRLHLLCSVTCTMHM